MNKRPPVPQTLLSLPTSTSNFSPSSSPTMSLQKSSGSRSPSSLGPIMGNKKKRSSIFLLTASMYVMMIVIIIMKHNESFRDIFILPQISLTYFYLVSETPSLYENNHYHEECLKCNSCGMNLSGANQKRARRFKNQILCDLHFADMALMESSDFMQQLRNFKPQSLGCAVARRKSSTTLIFPLPPQACSGKYQIFSLF